MSHSHHAKRSSPRSPYACILTIEGIADAHATGLWELLHGSYAQVWAVGLSQLDLQADCVAVAVETYRHTGLRWLRVVGGLHIGIKLGCGSTWDLER